MNIFIPASFSQTCHLYRSILPARHLSKVTPQHKWETGISDPSGSFDAIWVYGIQPLSNAPEFGSMKRRGVKIIWSLDDDVYHFPEWRHDQPSSEQLGMFSLLGELADLIVCSTPTLAEVINKPTKTVVAPNLIESDSYRTPHPPADDQRLRLMFSGSATHKGDLDLIDSACSQLLSKYEGRIEMYCVGAAPDLTMRDWWGRGLTFIDWLPLRQYFDGISQIRPHICLAPLVDCPFNRSKSNLRIMESWSINAAVVASPIGEYRLVNSEVDGLYATDTDGWVSQVSRLVEDRSLRERLAVSGHSRVKSEWDWSSLVARQKWQCVLDRIDALSV